MVGCVSRILGGGRSLRWILTLALLTSIGGWPAQAVAQTETSAGSTNLVGDGSFESPFVSIDQVYYAGQVIGPWTVDSGSVDVAARTVWLPPPGNGNQTLDVSGYGIGSVSQNVPTTAGQTYLLGFAVASDPNCGPNSKTLQVFWDGTLIATLDPSDVGKSPTNMGWKFAKYQVTASTTTTPLQFVSRTDTACGPVIDAVGVVAD